MESHWMHKKQERNELTLHSRNQGKTASAVLEKTRRNSLGWDLGSLGYICHYNDNFGIHSI